MSSPLGTQVSQHVTVRFFASARAATGMDEVRLELPPLASIADALQQVTAAPGQPLEQVLSRCSFLVNAVSTTDRATELSDGDVIDVMPPFAGG
ncbi:MAG: MoaD/ThiS family protein [Microbacteriaceae bacterium]|nr:MoaD/ThiS family protein [Microbacteriaceae bacterium]